MEVATQPSLPRLQGVFVPNVVPLDARSRINEDELRRYTRWLIEQGAHGLYPNGSTGEFLRFSPEERQRIVAVMQEESAGRVPILAGAAEANLRETLAACQRYHALGVRAVAVVSPIYYRLSPEAVYRYYRELGRETPLDVTLYNIPQFASPIDLPTVVRLAEECPRIIGIKDSSGDLPHMMRMLRAVRPRRPEFIFLTGWDPAMVPMLLAGCDGGTHATAGIAPRAVRRLYDLSRGNRWDEAMCLQYAVCELFDAVMALGEFPEGFRRALRLVGFECGEGRQPVASAEAGTLQRVQRALEAVDVGANQEPGT